MICIVCNSQKGGSGKSTVCRVLAVHSSHLGRSVFLIDTDTHGTIDAMANTWMMFFALLADLVLVPIKPSS